ncbi:MAG: DAK2 domain-containing protein [Parasporobacterium sp.]|nr:DAK2 domain-containing protein [Parasporobacterium sp.]
MNMNDYIDSRKLKRMFLGGTRYLDNSKDIINELNVFPVPDGDTGTNMTLTLMNAVRELSELPEEATMDEVAARIASGTLRGARGNSGVIMSQLCRGFSKGIEGAGILDRSRIAQACDQAVGAAYKAVMKPQEGTILTVAREVAAKAYELSFGELSLEEYFSRILTYARDVLQHTPELLPVLKEAGVVDSGGQGLVEFLRGAFDAFLEKEMDLSFTESAPEPVTSGKPDVPGVRVDTSQLTTSEIRFVYCTEFIIELEKPMSGQEEERFKEFLSSVGDSLVCVSMDRIVKVHVHTNHPGQVIERGLAYGQLTSLKIDNMRYEHHEKVIREAERAQQSESLVSGSAEPVNELGFVAVCTGEGIAEVFRGLQVDRIIEGGQTMNPSTEDFLEAIRSVPARSVILLPNNSNVILAASQAASICQDKKVYVVPTRNICEGISAMIGYDPSGSPEENAHLMEEAGQQVKCGEVTYAIRSTTISDTKIREGDYMGICGKEILAVSEDPDLTACGLIRAMAEEDTELITIYYGADGSEEDARKVADLVQEDLPEADIEVAWGGQSVYRYIISVE